MNKFRVKYKVPPLSTDDARPRLDFWGPVLREHGDNFLDLDFTLDKQQPPPERCPICAYRTLSFVANVYGWPTYECHQCGAGFIWPQPSSELLAQFYGQDYWSNYLGSTEPIYCRPWSAHGAKRGFEGVDRILGRKHKARILDVGAGDGTMLRYMADAGYQNILGIELDKENARRAKDKLGVPVISADFLTFQETGWDAIILWAVVEHLKAPHSYLRHGRDLLAPGGQFILMTGDNSSAHAWVQGKLDYWVYPPEHVFFFTVSSLRWLYRHSGYESFRWRIQFQPAWKESILWVQRFCRSIETRLRSRNPMWRSNETNLLMAWGKKP